MPQDSARISKELIIRRLAEDGGRWILKDISELIGRRASSFVQNLN